MPKKPAAKTRAPKQKKLVLRQANLVLLYNVPIRDVDELMAQAVPFGIRHVRNGLGIEDLQARALFLAKGAATTEFETEGLTGLIAFKNEKLAEAWFSREFGETDPKKCFLIQGEGEEFGSPDLAGAFVPV